MGALTHNGEVLQRLPANASQINFDNTGTNLNSTQTENAIKEVNTKVNTNTSDITQLKSGLIGVDKISQYIFNAETMTDFNDLVTDKAVTIYQIGYTANMSNKPSSGAFGLLVVYHVASYYIQLWLPADGNIMHRANTSDSWTAWT